MNIDKFILPIATDCWNALNEIDNMETKTIQRSNDTEYGSAANGRQIGSGYDVEIKRESKNTALICVTHLPTKEEWMTILDVEPEQDLQALACQIGQCPSAELDGFPFIDDWDMCVDRWNAIKVT